MILAFTGHTNIERCFRKPLIDNGEVYDTDVYNSIYEELETFIKAFAKLKGISLRELTIVTGMARGIDEIIGLVAIANKMDIIMAVPATIAWHQNRSYYKGNKVQAIYYGLFLGYPNKTIHEISKQYGTGHYLVNMARNQFMVDVADMVVSYKKYDSAGTDHCIKAAKKANKYFGNIPDFKRKTK